MLHFIFHYMPILVPTSVAWRRQCFNWLDLACRLSTDFSNYMSWGWRRESSCNENVVLFSEEGLDTGSAKTIAEHSAMDPALYHSCLWFDFLYFYKHMFMTLSVPSCYITHSFSLVFLTDHTHTIQNILINLEQSCLLKTFFKLKNFILISFANLNFLTSKFVVFHWKKTIMYMRTNFFFFKV